jgi:hypothetical protein
MPPIRFEARLEELVRRYRGAERTPTAAEVEALYTDGCAEMLVLETQLLRLKRMLSAAEADHDDPVAVREATELRRRRDQTAAELGSVRQLVRLLRTTVDWAAVSAQYERVA